MSTFLTDREREFCNYLGDALAFALKAEKDKSDNGDLQLIHKQCRGDAKIRLAKLTPEKFLESYLWCVGSIQKKIHVHEAHFPRQMELFRHCDAQRITKEAAAIRQEWQTDKRDLNGHMLEAMLTTAKLVAKGWAAFRQEYLPEPTVEGPDPWSSARNALDQLPMVGQPIASFLLRNLLGAPLVKLDLHIAAIANHFFGDEAEPVRSLENAICQHWGDVCTDQRFLPVHIGEVEYILWFYRQETGQPKAPNAEPLASRCETD